MCVNTCRATPSARKLCVTPSLRHLRPHLPQVHRHKDLFVGKVPWVLKLVYLAGHEPMNPHTARLRKASWCASVNPTLAR